VDVAGLVSDANDIVAFINGKLDYNKEFKQGFVLGVLPRNVTQAKKMLDDKKQSLDAAIELVVDDALLVLELRIVSFIPLGKIYLCVSQRLL
jgi:adenylate kinase